MSYRINVIAHTAASCNSDGSRNDNPARELVTIAIQGPRPVLAEFNTHRALCRNVESSRAVSIPMRVEMLRKNPYIPGPTPDGLSLKGNSKGMVALAPLSDGQVTRGRAIYQQAADFAADVLADLDDEGWAKQDANRVSEPYSWTRILSTGTRAAWNHFLWLRAADDVYPPLRFLARAIAVALARSTPRLVWSNGLDGWHLPYINDDDRERAGEEAINRWGTEGVRIDPADWLKEFGTPCPWRSFDEMVYLNCNLATMLCCRWSAARCATVSYYRFGDHKAYADLEQRFDTLFPIDWKAKPPHCSPAEHQARLSDMDVHNMGGNFGAYWIQYRKCLPGEYRPTYTPTADQLAAWNVPDETFETLT